MDTVPLGTAEEGKDVSNDDVVYTAQFQLFFFLGESGSDLLALSKNHYTS